MTNANVNEDRLRNTSSDDRANRAMQDRAVTEDRVMSDDERIEMFRKQHFQHVLPDLPKIPGYHTCWLSTTNQSDTIAHRVRLGYEPVRREDIPAWNFDTVSLKTGEHAGLIGINEMVAFKLSEKLYQEYMRYAHHDAPNEQAQKLVSDVEELKAQAKASKTYIQQFDGSDDLVDELRKPKPMFE